MRSLALVAPLIGCFCCGCSSVPPLGAASGTSDQETGILIGDVVNRIKCELADSFDDKIDDSRFAWLQNWTAKVDLTLQINDSAGLSPTVSYTKYYSNAFNFGAGSTSLTSRVIGTVAQTFVLTGGASYNEQAQRAEYLIYFVSARDKRLDGVD
jgi:hypothetical protein